MEFDTIQRKLQENRNIEESSTSKLDMISSLDLTATSEELIEEDVLQNNLFGEKIKQNEIVIKKVNRRERTAPATFTMYPSTKSKLISMAAEDGISASGLLDVLINAEANKRNLD